MPNNDKPLGLPAGSIRAVLALGVTLATCVFYLKMGAVPNGLLELTFLGWGFYFGQKIKGG